MSGVPGTPQNLNVQTANQQNLISWSLSPGASSYLVQRSLDNVTFTDLVTVSGSPLATSYLDSDVSLGTQYWYQVCATNGSGNSSFTLSQSAIPTRTGELSLQLLRLRAQQRADRVNGNFVNMIEWNGWINLAMFELYDLLITVYEDYNVATPVQFNTDGSTFLYPLPNGSNTFMNPLTNQTFTPKPFYKLMGVDLGLQTANNAYVTLNKFNFIDRNRFVYPNTAGTIYGVFNAQYRLLGLDRIEFIPTPSANQPIRLWYIPRLTELLQETDMTDISISGWIQYVIIRAAKYALDKEESDTTKLDQELMFLKQRIEETAANRDVGQPDKISDTRSNSGSGFGNGFGGGWNGSSGGW